jgi:hypothetical protein
MGILDAVVAVEAEILNTPPGAPELGGPATAAEKSAADIEHSRSSLASAAKSTR